MWYSYVIVCIRFFYLYICHPLVTRMQPVVTPFLPYIQKRGSCKNPDRRLNRAYLYVPPYAIGMIMKLNFIIIGPNSHKSQQKLESYDSLENERRSLNEEKIGSGSSVLQQVPGTFFGSLNFEQSRPELNFSLEIEIKTKLKERMILW